LIENTIAGFNQPYKKATVVLPPLTIWWGF
jgi:hypothetical protein